MKKRSWITPRRSHWLVFLLALGVRLWMVGESSQVDPAFSHPIIDEQTNVDMARGFLAQGPAHGTPYWKPPAYPLLLSMLASPWGDVGSSGQPVPVSFSWLVKILQSVLDSITALMICRLAAAYAGTVAGLLAGVLYSLALMPVFFCAQFLDTTLFTFLIVVAMTLARSALLESGSFGWVPVGMALGLASITRATGLPIALGVTLVALWQPATMLLRITRGSLVILAFTMTIVPVTALNWKIGGDAVLISSNGGINFYIGNRSGTSIGEDGLTSVAAGPRWNRLLARSSDLPRPSERSQHYYRLAVQEITEAPGDWLRQMVRKSAALLSARDVPNNKNLVEETDRNRVMQLLSFSPGSSGFLVALIVAGLLVGRRGLREDDLPIRMTLLMMALITLAFFVAGRYRVPLMALGCIVAARGLVVLAAHRKALLLYPLLLILVFAIPVPGRELMQNYCIDPVAIGNVHEHRGESQQAARWYLRSLEQDPDDARAHHKLGHLAQEAGDPAAAITFFRKATEVDPDFTASWNSLGWMMIKDDPQQALRCFQEAVRRDPSYTGAWINLGMFHEGRNDLRKAQDAYQRARKLQPERVLPPILEARIQLKLRAPEKASRLLQMVDQTLLAGDSEELFQQIEAQIHTAQEKTQEKEPEPSTSPQEDTPDDRPEQRGRVG